MPRAESLLAGAAALVGCIGVASSLTPEFAGRYQIVHGVLPPGAPHAARVVWLARFTAPGDPEAARPLFVVLLLAAGVGALTAGMELRGVAIPDRLGDVFQAAGLVLFFSALFIWLRPLSHAV